MSGAQQRERDRVPERRREVAARDRADVGAVEQHAARRRAPGAALRSRCRAAGGPLPARARPRAASRPRKSPLSHRTTQPSPACSGVMPGPSSWPCNGRPASRRSVSRAPSPAGVTPAADDRVPERRARARPARGSRRRLRRCSRCRRRPTRPPRATENRGTAAASALTVAEQRAARSGPCTASTARDRGDVGELDRAAHPRDRFRGRAPTSAIGVRRVRHHEEAIGLDPPHDDVVDDVRVDRVEQVRVLRAAGLDPAEVVGEQPLERVERARPAELDGAEVRHVEHDRALRGTLGARRARPCTGAASPSRRTAPSARRARGAARRAG